MREVSSLEVKGDTCLIKTSLAQGSSPVLLPPHFCALRGECEVREMTKLEDHLEGIINIFHHYSIRLGNYDTLNKSELKKLITKELPNALKNTKDQPSIDKLFQELDADKDAQVTFEEFVVLVSRVLKTAHEAIHQE
ncbi:LOW QUALITY PROTEIN: protein S100-A12 [Monodon monoceros]|uniref:LOW QUALITY PROTEIN: protein S100-A12 n=3 Tax=Monodontidae TaxID=9747 RepID=A0A2Y9M888_DELLE|nr:LOW QUALITY PROTEIN: protein S100-A12 [Delphinapterus leucas]XP_029086491.1 LOW QUALITY PROTEIN: protein S100-A12 [Monodon monoceros]